MRQHEDKYQAQLDGINDIRAHRIGKWVTAKHAGNAAREEYLSLCKSHRKQWDDAWEYASTVAKNTPAPITLMHIGRAIDRIEIVRLAANEQFLRIMDCEQQIALKACRAGYGCTITEPVQDALPGCAA